MDDSPTNRVTPELDQAPGYSISYKVHIPAEVSGLPTYEYRCGSCRHHYEKRESFDAPSLQVCPACGAEARRVLHPAPIVFKGSGFYSTDNRKSTSATIDSPPTAKSEGEGSEPASDGKDTPAVAST